MGPEVTRYATDSKKILVGNKSDCGNRAVDSSEPKTFAEKNGFLYYETSAKSGENLREAFTALAKEIYEGKSIPGVG